MMSDEFEIQTPTTSETTSDSDIGPAVSPDGTISKRHFAAGADYLFTCILAILVAKLLPAEMIVVQGVVAALVVLGYYFGFETLLSSTPGKMLNGLIVVGYDDGSPCTAQQAFIRTVWRLLEVNPFLFGGLPAAALIVFTRNRQRLGDRFAGTVVVRR